MINFLNQRHLNLVVVFLLIIVNLLAVYYFDFFYSRLFRFITASLFFIFYFFASVKFKLKHNAKLILAIVVFFLLSDYFLMHHSKESYTYFYVFSRYLRHIFLIFLISKYVNFKKVDRFTFLIITIVLIINIGGVALILDLIKPTIYNPIRFYLYIPESLIMLAFGYLAIIYGLGFNTKKSLHFVVGIIAIVFSDIFYVLGFHLNIYILFYFSRLLYLIGLVYFISSLLIQNHTLKFNENE